MCLALFSKPLHLNCTCCVYERLHSDSACHCAVICVLFVLNVRFFPFALVDTFSIMAPWLCRRPFVQSNLHHHMSMSFEAACLYIWCIIFNNNYICPPLSMPLDSQCQSSLCKFRYSTRQFYLRICTEKMLIHGICVVTEPHIRRDGGRYCFCTSNNIHLVFVFFCRPQWHAPPVNIRGEQICANWRAWSAYLQNPCSFWWEREPEECSLWNFLFHLTFQFYSIQWSRWYYQQQWNSDSYLTPRTTSSSIFQFSSAQQTNSL